MIQDRIGQEARVALWAHRGNWKRQCQPAKIRMAFGFKLLF